MFSIEDNWVQDRTASITSSFTQKGDLSSSPTAGAKPFPLRKSYLLTYRPSVILRFIQYSSLKTMTFSSPQSSTQHLNIPPQLKSNTIFPLPSTSSIPIIPPSPSPVLPQRSPADRCSSPPAPATCRTADARLRFGEKRTMAPAVRAAERRRKESPFPVPETGQ